jgi:hypothetical protein
MNDNFFISMISEGGKISHKRWISVTVAAALIWAIVYAVIHGGTDVARKDVIQSVMVFILIMSGVATVAQIAGIFKGTAATAQQPEPPEPPAEQPKDEPKTE